MTLPQILYTRTEVRDQDTILCDIAFPDGNTESDVLNKFNMIDKILEDYLGLVYLLTNTTSRFFLKCINFI